MREPLSITHESLYGTPVLAIHAMGVVLVLSQRDYDRAIMRGKLLRREQANAARETRAAERAEMQEIGFPWSAPYEEERLS